MINSASQERVRLQDHVVKTIEMLMGGEEYCTGYLDAVRAGQISV